MGKKTSSKRGRSAASSGDKVVWTAADHAERKVKQQHKIDTDSARAEKQHRRTAVLTRGSKAKREEAKIRLHIVKTQRELDQLRQRLEVWDDAEEARRIQQEEQERKQQLQQQDEPKKRKGRLGPETWKLKGAARPAWQVYDFDTRYVDPHIKAHADAKEKAQRCRNLLVIYKGRFGEEDTDDAPPQPVCRAFLGLLMQLGLLNVQAKSFKHARTVFLECMDLDSEEHPVTPARCHLMRLYMESNRPDSARRLWGRLSPEDSSVWICYSAALVEFISWKILNEAGSTETSAELLLARAIKANVFCAYYLSFYDTFQEVMDYTDDIEDAHEGKPLEEAIEYCCSEQMGAWQGTEGAVEWVRDVMLRAIHGDPVAGGTLSPSNLEWRAKLSQIKNEHQANLSDTKEADDHVEEEADGNEEEDDEANEAVADVEMFAGMFSTAIDMIESAGELRRRPEK
jgi:hypothetical protein